MHKSIACVVCVFFVNLVYQGADPLHAFCSTTTVSNKYASRDTYTPQQVLYMILYIGSLK